MWTIIGIMVFIILLVTFWQLWVALFIAILGIILFPIAFLMSIFEDKEKRN